MAQLLPSHEIETLTTWPSNIWHFKLLETQPSLSTNDDRAEEVEAAFNETVSTPVRVTSGSIFALSRCRRSKLR
jgi:hypothetical protein